MAMPRISTRTLLPSRTENATSTQGRYGACNNWNLIKSWMKHNSIELPFFNEKVNNFNNSIKKWLFFLNLLWMVRVQRSSSWHTDCALPTHKRALLSANVLGKVNWRTKHKSRGIKDDFATVRKFKSAGYCWKLYHSWDAAKYEHVDEIGCSSSERTFLQHPTVAICEYHVEEKVEIESPKEKEWGDQSP